MPPGWVIIGHLLLIRNNLEPLGRHAIQHLSKSQNQLLIVDPTKPVGVLFQFGQRLLQLGLGAVDVPLGAVVAADGCLDQPLIEEPKGATSLPPQVFPSLVGLEIPSFIEIIYSELQEIGHFPVYANC